MNKYVDNLLTIYQRFNEDGFQYYLFSSRTSFIDLFSNFFGVGSHLRFAATINGTIVVKNVCHSSTSASIQYGDSIKKFRFRIRRMNKHKFKAPKIFKIVLKLVQNVFIVAGLLLGYKQIIFCLYIKYIFLYILVL